MRMRDLRVRANPTGAPPAFQALVGSANLR